MNAENAAAEFRNHLAARGAAESTLTPRSAADAVFSFYRDVRADDCDLDRDGDLLLFQWGTYDWGQGERFEWDITRQFIVGAGEDDDMSQLHVTFRFAADPTLRSLGSGDRWCSSPVELADFIEFVNDCPASLAVYARTDGEKEIRLDGV
jgi:hypothetical protein